MSQIDDDSIDTLDEHLYIHGIKRVDAPPDGHCVIHRWRMGLAEVGTKMEHEELLQLAVTEISDNLHFYSEFLPGEDLSSQLEAYALVHNYQSTVVDLMVYALANATNTTCIVFSVLDGEVWTTKIEPRPGNEANHTIHVCKFGPHYDAVLDMRTPLDAVAGETTVSLMEFSLMCSRTLTITLFCKKLHIFVQVKLKHHGLLLDLQAIYVQPTTCNSSDLRQAIVSYLSPTMKMSASI